MAQVRNAMGWSEKWIMITVGLDVVTFRSNFLTKHLETVVAGFVDFARLAFGAEVAITRCQFIDDSIESKITITRCLLALHNLHTVTLQDTGF